MNRAKNLYQPKPRLPAMVKFRLFTITGLVLTDFSTFYVLGLAAFGG